MFLKKFPKTKPLIFVGKKINWNAQRSHGGLIHPYVATHTNLVHVMNVIVANANSPLLSSPWLTLAKGVCLYNDLHCCIRKRHVTLIITLHLCEPFIFHSNLIYTHTHTTRLISWMFALFLKEWEPCVCRTPYTNPLKWKISWPKTWLYNLHQKLCK